MKNIDPETFLFGIVLVGIGMGLGVVLCWMVELFLL